MIHFDFKLNDEDAENLFSLFGSAISNDLSMILDELAKENPDDDVINAIRKDIDYLTALKLKLTNGAVF